MKTQVKTITAVALTLGFVLTLTLCVDPALSAEEEAESDCFISDLILEITVSTKRQTINEMGLTPPCEPNDADDETCTIVLDSVTVVFDGNLTATTAKYIPFAAFCISGSLSRRCVEGVWVDESIIQEVASEEVLEGLDIFLIAIVIILVLIGSIFLTCMGVMFVIRSATDCAFYFGLILVLVAWLTVVPIALPLSIILWCRSSAECESSHGVKCWYVLAGMIGALVTLSAAVLCIINTTYSLQNEFYGEGPLRDDDGMCDYHEANTSEKRVQNILKIVSVVMSVLTLKVWPVLLCIAKCYAKEWGKKG